jgi:hypothetical protein
MNDLERRQRRLDRAWIAIRFELFVAVAVPVGIGLLYVTAPDMGGGFSTERFSVVQALPWLGVLGYVLGLVWMIRLARPTTEDGEDSWRFRHQMGAVTASGRHHRARRLWPFLLLVSAVVALGLFSLINGTMTHGGMTYWWDEVGLGIRDLIRGIWSDLTGQPQTRDLFPF